MTNFQQASNFVIQQLNQMDVRVDIEQQKQKAFSLLLNEIVQGASHNAGERYDAPKCHPDTRKAVLDYIRSWVDNDSESTRIMWLNGPAGEGKSAISQTTAEDFHNERKLVASYFFSKFVPGRNTKNGLIATIAYQLSVSIPAVKAHIIDAIVRNPNIFKENIKSQFQTLALEPYGLLGHAQERDNKRPRFIIIDGLDECDNADHQDEIINALATSLSKDQTPGLRILLASRPEPRIQQAFNVEVVTSMCTRLALDDNYNPDKDIELFLRSSFETLKLHHVLSPMLQSSDWPSDTTIENLVQKSSGQFIYAATAVKYITDPQQNPMKRLDTVLNITAANESDEPPLAQLDALYTAILSNIRRDYKKVALIFKAMMFLYTVNKPGNHLYRGRILSASFLDEFLHFENELPLFLADLSSIVNTNEVEKGGYRFFHASFTDYLRDSSRSQEFHIDERESHVCLAMYCMSHITGPPGLSETVSEYSVYGLFEHFKRSNWNDTVLESILSNDLLAAGNAKSYMMKARNSYMLSNYNTFLGLLIRIAYDREKTEDNLRYAIDAAFLTHLQQCEPEDVVTAYYSTWLQLTEIGLSQTVPALMEVDTSKQNILFDAFHLNTPVLKWFKHLIQETGYLSHVSQGTYIKSACRILEILMGIARSSYDKYSLGYDTNPESDSMIPVSFLQLAKDLFDNLPTSDETATAIYQKWESLQPTSEELDGTSYGIKFRIKLLDEIIQSYLNRSSKKDVDSKGTKEDAEHLSSDIGSGSYSKSYNALMILVIAQFLLIVYMYMTSVRAM